MKHRTILFWSLLLLLHTSLCGQGISVQAPETVFVGDNFTVTFTVEGELQSFNAPSFKGFTLRGRPQQGTSYSFSNRNGRSSNSTQSSLTYSLTADAEGTFTIGSASCTVNGKKLTSNSFTVKVIKPTATQQQQRQQQQQQQQQRRSSFDPFGFFDIDPNDFFSMDPWGQQQQPQAAPKIDNRSLFVRASANKTNLYEGEQLIVSYKIYFQTPNVQVSKEKLPSNKSFWCEKLPTAKTKEEIVDGRHYWVAEYSREALFPQKSGSLSTEPLELTMQVPVRQNPFYPTQYAEHSIHSNPININVKPLPSSPDGFSNAVGSFTVKGGLSLDSVKAGDAVSYKLTVSGRGNLMLITPPDPSFPKSFERYDPQIQDNINRGEGGISGSRTYEWVLIPREDGTFTIPTYRFIYFDPAAGQYKTLTVDAQTVTVLPGANQPAKQSDNQANKQSGNNILTYVLYILSALAIVFIIVAVVRWLLKRYRSRNVDPVAQRKRNALRIAQRRLKKAASHMAAGESEPFYQEIYRAIWGCLSDKYNIPTSQLNRDTVTTCLIQKQVPEEQQQRILQLLNEVDLARFAPGNPETQMQHIYQQTLDVISEI